MVGALALRHTDNGSHFPDVLGAATEGAEGGSELLCFTSPPSPVTCSRNSASRMATEMPITPSWEMDVRMVRPCMGQGGVAKQVANG